MIVLNGSDSLTGLAATAAKVDYTVHGYHRVADNPEFMANGQLANSETDLLDAAGVVRVIKYITLLNTHTSGLACDVYLKKNDGTSRQIANVTLAAGYGAYITEHGVSVVDTNGGVTYVTTYGLHAAAHTDGTDDIQDATAAQKGLMTAAYGTKLDGIAAGANLYVHPNHSGDVTSVADGAQTIANDAVTYAKMQNVSATDKVLGRATAGAGDVEEIACTSAGRALIDDANAAAQRTTLGLVIDTNVAASAGEGHITIIPSAYDSIGQGTWTWLADTTKWSAAAFYNSSSADADELDYKVYLAAGTYTIMLLHDTSSGRGIVDVDIDAGEVMSVDMYAASGANNVRTVDTGNVISTSGLKALTLRLDGKHASSTNYIAVIGAIMLWRTA